MIEYKLRFQVKLKVYIQNIATCVLNTGYLYKI